MGRKVFVSYKYADRHVLSLPGIFDTRVRDYVDILQSKFDSTDHIFKGEDDGEDLSSLVDSTIGSKLGDKIFDSTMTIVLISKGMRESRPEEDQWIPWEVSYSLREQSRDGKNSKTNAMLAVVLPDIFGSDEYFLQPNPGCTSTTYMTNILFRILGENMFNMKAPATRPCNGNIVHSGYFNYIHVVRWNDFISDINKYIEIAYDIWRNRDNYLLRKFV